MSLPLARRATAPDGVAGELLADVAVRLAEARTSPEPADYEPALQQAFAARLQGVAVSRGLSAATAWRLATGDDVAPEVAPAQDAALPELATAWEQLLGWSVRAGEDGPELTPLDGGRRKTTGTFYTPPDLARQLAAQVLAGMDRPRVVDPACGTGIFLLATLDILGECHSPPAIAADSIHGVDLDARAVAICRALLWIAGGGGNELAAVLRDRIHCGDALIGPVPGVAEAQAPDGLVPFDWGTAFPHVLPGGFDAVLGNPPWDKIKPFAREFFPRECPDMAGLTRTALEREMARRLSYDPGLAARWEEWRQRHLRRAAWIRDSGHYHLQGRGDANTYKAFVERALQLVAPTGRVGMVLPYSICIDLGAADLRREIFGRHRPVRVEVFDNRAGTFRISSMVNFATVICDGGGTRTSARGEIAQVVGGRAASLPWSLVRAVSPDSLSLPRIESPADVALLDRVYRDAPLLGGGGDVAGTLHTGWRRELDLTLDFRRFNLDGRGLRVFEGKMIHQYRLDWAGRCETGERWIKESPPLASDGLPRARYHIDEPLTADWRCAIRLIQNARNRRTLIATLLPPGVLAGNSLATARPAGADEPRHARLRRHLLLCGLLNSLVLDRIVRMKIDANLNMFHLAQLPLPPALRTDRTGDGHSLALAIGPRVLALLADRAPDVFAGLQGIVTVVADDWTAAACAHAGQCAAGLAAEIDAAVADAWGLDAATREHVLAGFRDVPDATRRCLLAVADSRHAG